MRRVVVLGGAGFFGRAAAERLRAQGIRPLVSSRRRRADLRIDANDRSSIEESLQPGDVVVDAAGPFQRRTMSLIESAIAIRFDVVDLSDSLHYALAVHDRSARIEEAGIRVLTSCSSLSTVVAALLRLSGVLEPERVSVFLAPASRESATPGTGGSLAGSLGRPIRILQDGHLVDAVGWARSRRFVMPAPVGAGRGYQTESVDAVTLPRIWPSLREVDLWIDSRIAGLNALLALGSRLPMLRRGFGAASRYATPLVRLFGRPGGGMMVEIEGDGRVQRLTILAPSRSYLMAVAPLVLATHALAAGTFEAIGLVPPDRHVDPQELIERICGIGMSFHRRE